MRHMPWLFTLLVLGIALAATATQPATSRAVLAVEGMT